MFGYSPLRRAADRVTAAAALGLCVAVLATVAASTSVHAGPVYGANANVRAFTETAGAFTTVVDEQVDNYSANSIPRATLPRDLAAIASGVGFASAGANAQVGRLGVRTRASYPSGYLFPFYVGGSNAEATATFADTIHIVVPPGSPVEGVSLTLWTHLDGGVTDTRPDDIGAYAVAELEMRSRITNIDTGESITQLYGSRNVNPGWFATSARVPIGANLLLTGSLAAAAGVNSNARVITTAEADYLNTALYYLSADVDGVTFVSDSGHDYRLPPTAVGVPAPSTALLLALGALALLGARTRLWRAIGVKR